MIVVISVICLQLVSGQVAAKPQTKPTNMGCESACRLLPTTPNIAIYWYYSAQRMTLILPSHGG